jgi:hypothetical protein
MNQQRQQPNILLLFKIIAYLISSWILVHLLSVFGAFLAVAYPLWWLFSPDSTICFMCRSGKEGKKCPFCQETIVKNQTFPKRPLSAVLNGILILSFSLFSIGIVYGESKLLYKLGFPPTPKTVSFIIPTKGQYKLGEVFPMNIEITGIKAPINAVQADLGFDNQRVELMDISTEGSFANIFVQKDINNEAGYARLTGGLANPGFLGEKGLFGTAFFKAKIPGVVKIEFLPTSLVLANDGRGGNVLNQLSSVSYLILPEKVTDEEARSQTMIFNETKVLGKKSEETQMIFYDQKPVLGLETDINSSFKVEKQGFGDILLNVLGYIDSFILTFWTKLFNFENTILLK